MTNPGMTQLRKRDVYHLLVNELTSVKAYFATVGFRNQRKQEKLEDLIAATALPPGGRFNWFTEH